MSKRGYTAIMTILIISAAIMITAVTSSVLSLGEGQASFAHFKGEKELQFVEGCAENALQSLRASSSYTGGSISSPEGTCTITVTGTSPNYTITATSTFNDFRKSIQIEVQRSGLLLVSSWKEI